MNNNKKITPKDFFFNLGSIVLLYILISNILRLFFGIIDKINPDPLLNYYGYEIESIRWSLAILIIFYPLYLYLNRMISIDTKKDPSKREVGIRKWLNYLTIFLSGFIISWGFIMILNGFLGGDLTLNFIMKSISAGVVLATVFKYYLDDLKENNSYNRSIFYVANMVVVIGLFGGFYLIGSPATQRMLRFDQNRINDLQNIQWQIVNFWQQKGSLPLSQEEIVDPISGFKVPFDPKTKERYGYERITETEFKLCANFELESENDLNFRDVPQKAIIETPGFNNDIWEHPKGPHCFERKIDKDLYPPRIPKN